MRMGMWPVDTRIIPCVVNYENVVLVCQFDEVVVKCLKNPTYLIGKQRLIF